MSTRSAPRAAHGRGRRVGESSVVGKERGKGGSERGRGFKFFLEIFYVLYIFRKIVRHIF